MTVAKALVYGTDEIRLRDDTNIEAILASIENALDGKQSRWIEIQGKSHPKWILVTQGLQISAESFEKDPTRRSTQIV